MVVDLWARQYARLHRRQDSAPAGLPGCRRPSFDMFVQMWQVLRAMIVERLFKIKVGRGEVRLLVLEFVRGVW